MDKLVNFDQMAILADGFINELVEHFDLTNPEHRVMIRQILKIMYEKNRI